MPIVSDTLAKGFRWAVLCRAVSTKAFYTVNPTMTLPQRIRSPGPQLSRNYRRKARDSAIAQREEKDYVAPCAGAYTDAENCRNMLPTGSFALLLAVKASRVLASTII